MTGDIKFSIMTPVYKVEEYLDECVQSVLNQSYENFELILVDDGSPDRCGEMCDAWAEKDSRIKVYHKPNGGLLHTRSYALERASGDYYLFLDSDDYLLSGALETLYSNICRTDCDCMIFGLENVYDNRVFFRYTCTDDIAGRVICDKRELYNIVFCNGSYNSLCRKCVRASCFDGRDYSPYYSVTNGEDLLRSLEIFENAASFLFIPDILYAYRRNPESMSNTVFLDDIDTEDRVAPLVDGFLAQENCFEAVDYDRLRNTRLDNLAILMRRIARGCSSDEAAVRSMEKLRRDEHIDGLVRAGYRPVPDHPGIEKTGLCRKALLRLDIALFTKGRFKSLLLADRVMLKLLGR